MKKQLEAIRKIDPKAAEYIETVVIPRYGEKKAQEKVNVNHDIFDLFLWALTPQGNRYWYGIYGVIHGTA